MANDVVPFYEPGAALTGHVGVAVLGKRFVSINANRQAGPALNTSAGGGNVVVGPTGAGAKVFGVAAYDAAVGTKVKIYSLLAVVPVVAGAAIAAGQEVESNAVGQAVPLVVAPGTPGKVAGICLSACAAGADAQIQLR